MKASVSSPVAGLLLPPNLDRPAAAVGTIAFTVLPPRAARSRWRHLDHALAGHRRPVRPLSVGDADPLCVGTVAIMHAAASALLSATDESEGL
ncbi:MAG TPA: hypothetical protein VIJ48_03270, partial [Acidimicrobiia bacterium]